VTKVLVLTTSAQVAPAGSGKIVYIAGQLARDIDGNCVGKGDIRAQMEQTFQNLDRCLKAPQRVQPETKKLPSMIKSPVQGKYPLGRQCTTRIVRERNDRGNSGSFSEERIVPGTGTSMTYVHVASKVRYRRRVISHRAGNRPSCPAAVVLVSARVGSVGWAAIRAPWTRNVECATYRGSLC
jgi:hypothetical protein